MKTPETKAKNRILELLKTGGPQESGELAELLGVSAMAVRQHLYAFQKRGWVDFEERSRPMGRPAKVWELTEQAEQFFPDRHNDLLLSFIDGIEKTLGKESLNKLLEHRAKEQIEEYSAQLNGQTKLRKKVDQLAKIRSKEGYMAEVQKSDSGGYLLIENHCPICRAAQTCSGLCESELEVFRKSLGEGVSVDRIEHILSGERRCVYHISDF
ncbi:MAG: transcriptional regulator [Verrucomicrobia bacterium]|nr:transcriptional regulator [Verrucomicrobiota bacterium]